MKDFLPNTGSVLEPKFFFWFLDQRSKSVFFSFRTVIRKVTKSGNRLYYLTGRFLIAVDGVIHIVPWNFVTELFIHVVHVDDATSLFFPGGALLASTISSPWNSASTGPPADTNGSGSDTKNLDVGDIDDVSDVSVSFPFFFCFKHGVLHAVVRVSPGISDCLISPYPTPKTRASRYPGHSPSFIINSGSLILMRK